MTNTKPHLEPIEAINYLRFIPSELHQEANDFVLYAASRPFAKPTDCPHCSSRSFYPKTRGKQRSALIKYYCRGCLSTFSSVSRTNFNSFSSHDEWEDLAMAMLAGLGTKDRLKLVPVTNLRSREQALETVMLEEFSALYQWWLLFRYPSEKTDIEIPPQVKAQSDEFQAWLQNLLTPKVVVCPRCQSQKCSHLKAEQKNQAAYRCRLCRHKFSVLASTRFKGLKHTLELPDAFDLMLRGASDSEIEIKQNSSSGRAWQWRNKFMLQLRDLNLDLLADWIKWKRYCRLSETASHKKPISQKTG